MESNWSYLPKQWHDIIGSTGYQSKYNLTSFFKIIYDKLDAGATVKTDDLLRSIARRGEYFTSSAENLQKQVRHLVKHLVKTTDGNYDLLWDFVRTYPDKDITLEEFQRLHGYKLFSDSTEDLQEGWETDEVRKELGSPNEDENSLSYLENLRDFGLIVDNDDEGFQIPKNLTLRYFAPVMEEFISDRASYHMDNEDSGYAAPTYLSNELCQLLEIPIYQKIPRTEVTRRIITYIMKNQLTDANDRRIIHPDEQLSKVVGTEEERIETMQQRKDLIKSKYPTNAKKADSVVVTGDLTFFNLPVHLNKHFSKSKKLIGLYGCEGWGDVLDELKIRFQNNGKKRKCPEDDLIDHAADSESQDSNAGIFKRIRNMLYSYIF